MIYWIIELFRYADVDLVGVTSAGNFCRRKAATSFENGISCYRGLGMTQDCARIWADTSWNTAKNCFSSCVLDPTLPIPKLFGDDNENKDGNSNNTKAPSWFDLPVTLRKRIFSSMNSTVSSSSSPSNGPAPECALNECLLCNNEVSNPTFDLFAGRSRHRSGLLSTAAQPCGSIPKILQEPCPVTRPLVG